MSDAKNDKAAIAPKYTAPEGFEKVVVEMPSFKPEPFSEREAPGSKMQVYTGRPLQGEILGARNFGSMTDADGNIQSDENGVVRDMIALLVKAEVEVECIGRDDKTVIVKPGETILWFATTQIRQSITQTLRLDAEGRAQADQIFVRAMNGEYGLRFFCMPLKQVPHTKHAAKGYKMWTYDFRLHPQPVKRLGSNGLGRYFQHAALPAAQTQAPQHANGTVLPATAR